TDPALAANRAWAAEIRDRALTPVQAQLTTTVSAVDDAVQRARAAGDEWGRRPGSERRRILFAVADALESRRGELVSTMIHEGSKTIAEADPEVSEAVDFARYYAERSEDLAAIEGSEFSPAGVVAVVPPWNFPVAIPAGGVLAA